MDARHQHQLSRMATTTLGNLAEGLFFSVSPSLPGKDVLNCLIHPALQTSPVDRRTTSDDVFDRLHSDIVSLKLLPGARLSEVDVARQFDISRQPVREAFIRLHDLELLQVKPQRATQVRRISEQALLNARFIRTAVEIELLRIACSDDTSDYNQAFENNLDQQQAAITDNRVTHFHSLDYDFHHLICQAANREHAFETVSTSKSQLDRLCLLSLTEEAEMVQIYKDHLALYHCIRDNNGEQALELIRRHLSRVINLLNSVRASHPEYFADE